MAITTSYTVGSEANLVAALHGTELTGAVSAAPNPPCTMSFSSMFRLLGADAGHSQAATATVNRGAVFASHSSAAWPVTPDGR